MLRSVLHFPLGHPAIGHRRANVAFSACRHFHITQLCRAARKQTVDSDTPSETPEPRKRRRNLPKPTREVELTDDRITLPNPLDWRSVFPPIKLKDRISVSNPDTAAEMAEAFVPEGSKDKVVIEAFPGPGALTRALLALPKERIRKLIVIEDNEKYLEYLEPLKELDSRLEIVPRNGFAWDAYLFLEDTGLLDGVTPHDWKEGIHPHLHFISHLPLAVMGEQFLSQLLRCIPESDWLFKFGRVPMNLVLSEYAWNRLIAPLGDNTRSKLTVIAEATAAYELSLETDQTSPFDDHFHPTQTRIAPADGVATKLHRTLNTPFVAAQIIPHEHQAIEKGRLEAWDYCLRKLFVLKGSPLKSAIGHLAPGSNTLLKKIADPSLPKQKRVNVTTQIRSLTVNDWTIITNAFEEWPFRPESLMVTDAFREDDRRLG